MRAAIGIWIFALSIVSPSALARTIVVSEVGKGLRDIQDAIDLAEDGDVVEVRLRSATLKEPLDFRGKAIAVIGHKCTLRLSAAPRDPKRACTVFFGSGETERSVLEGFRIVGGPGYYGLGGAIYCDAPASPTIRRCEIQSTEGAGCAVVLTGKARLIECTISRSLGIAVYCGNRSAPELWGCRILGTASGKRSHPAIYCDDGSSPTLVNCVVAGSEGDAIYCGEARGSTLALRYSTIADNGGAGVRADPASRVVLDSSIVWGNAGGGIVLAPGAEAEVSHSIVEGPEVWPGEGNLALDPRLAGDPSSGDYRPLTGSPAIDAGDPASSPEMDIAGRARPNGRAPDIGAWESHEDLRRFVRGDVTADGKINMTDSIALLVWYFLCLCPPSYSCMEAADPNDDGTINITDAIYILNWLFLGGFEPAPPGPDACGVMRPDDTVDLGCDRFPPCE